jgi:hypothetical protein
MSVVAPDGSRARFFFPWWVMAYQLAGEAGLEALGRKCVEERELAKLLSHGGILGSVTQIEKCEWRVEIQRHDSGF